MQNTTKVASSSTQDEKGTRNFLPGESWPDLHGYVEQAPCCSCPLRLLAFVLPLPAGIIQKVRRVPYKWTRILNQSRDAHQKKSFTTSAAKRLSSGGALSYWQNHLHTTHHPLGLRTTTTAANKSMVPGMNTYQAAITDPDHFSIWLSCKRGSSSCAAVTKYITTIPAMVLQTYIHTHIYKTFRKWLSFVSHSLLFFAPNMKIHCRNPEGRTCQGWVDCMDD